MERVEQHYGDPKLRSLDFGQEQSWSSLGVEYRRVPGWVHPYPVLHMDHDKMPIAQYLLAALRAHIPPALGPFVAGLKRMYLGVDPLGRMAPACKKLYGYRIDKQ